MTTRTWILVCDASRARIFSKENKVSKLKLVEELEHPASRAHGRDLMADRPGRQQQIGGKTERAAMEPRTDPKRVEAERFARELTVRLSKGLTDHGFERLIVVAPPQFLGMLRSSFDTQVTQRVMTWIEKDYTHTDERQLTERLRDVVLI